MTAGVPSLLDVGDDHIWVYKPAGMQVHRQHRGDPGPFLLQWLRDAVGFRVYPAHRLDKPTCGLMVFATSSDAAARLGEAFRERQVEKRYHAIVRGHITEDGCIDHPLGAVRDRFATPPTEPKDATTEYRVLAKSEMAEAVGRYDSARYSLVELRPKTGRRHQLRRHLKHIFHPILGDRKYGDRDHNRFAANLGFERLALGSVSLCIPSLQLAHSVQLDDEILRLAHTLGLRSDD